MISSCSGCVKLHDFLRIFVLLFIFILILALRTSLFGVAHVMKKPLLMQACELAFAEYDVTNGMQAPWLVEIGICKA
ncbi:hypothetical protein E1A91_D06G151000v1 [Gossypium mustelinum]|uniref:Uncharacterized protein n=1 Tax=Gossypium mustelinum TaxID=34275 RepID=A0A5D2ULA9_GOSMU|nr:hypothetical protein E1A91_D06G151000v1 [Gossypium mustelinum]